MKKLILIAFTLVLFAFLFSSCGTQTACGSSGGKNYKNTIVN